MSQMGDLQRIIRPRLYSAWISGYLAACVDLAGECGSATDAMRREFPELQRVFGRVLHKGAAKKGTPHWWCKTPDGTIVDPTWTQFKGTLRYVEDPKQWRSP